MALSNILRAAGVTVATVAVIAVTAKVLTDMENKKQAKWDARLAKALADINLGVVLGDFDKEREAIGLRFRANIARLFEDNKRMTELEKEIAQFVNQ